MSQFQAPDTHSSMSDAAEHALFMARQAFFIILNLRRQNATVGGFDGILSILDSEGRVHGTQTFRLTQLPNLAAAKLGTNFWGSDNLERLAANCGW